MSVAPRVEPVQYLLEEMLGFGWGRAPRAWHDRLLQVPELHLRYKHMRGGRSPGGQWTVAEAQLESLRDVDEARGQTHALRSHDARQPEGRLGSPAVHG